MMYLPDEMHRYLAREAKGRGVSMAEVAREAISYYRASHGDARTSSVEALVGALGDDVADPEMSVRVDETLAEYFAQDGDWERENLRADEPR